jgi:hypothetical protein
MSLINDALKRASQTEKNRPRRISSPLSMEPTPTVRNPRLSLLLIGTMLVSLLLACWCFWQWWMMRHEAGPTRVMANAAPAVPTVPIIAPTPAPIAPAVAAAPVHVVPAPVVTPKPAPIAPAAPLVAVATVTPPRPAPAPAVVDAAPALVPPPVVPAPLEPQPVMPEVSNFNPSPWPVDLKLNAIFFSKSNARVLINGNTYSVGDDIQGVVLKKIERDKVTLQWNGHTRVLTLPGQ